MKQKDKQFLTRLKDSSNLSGIFLLIVSIFLFTGCNSDLERYVNIYNNNQSDFSGLIEIMERYPEVQEIRVVNEYTILEDPSYFVVDGFKLLKYDFRSSKNIEIDNDRARMLTSSVRQYFDKYNIMVIYNFISEENISIIQNNGYGWIYMKNEGAPNMEDLSIARMDRINSRWYAIVTA